MIQPLFIRLFALVLFIQSSGFAQYAEKYVAGSTSVMVDEANFRLLITPAGATLLDVSVDKRADVPIRLHLRDDNRQTLLSQSAAAADRPHRTLFVRRLDLCELDNGTYWLSIQVGKTHVVRKLRVVSLRADEQIVIVD